MAIVFEVNVVCSRLVDLDCLFHKTDIRSLGIEIGKISSMDNWFWENRTTNSNMTAIQKGLNAGKIIDIEFESNAPNSSGVFIEMHNSVYVYCFWVNVDIEYGIDEFGITQGNKQHLQKIYSIFETYQKLQDSGLLLLGAGFETTFSYDGDIMSTINKSQNIIVWLINDSLNSELPMSGYKENRVCSHFVSFEKWTNMSEAPNTSEIQPPTGLLF